MANATNSVTLIGRTTKDVSINTGASGTTSGRFTLAVERPYKKDATVTADFISCVAFGKTAEFFEAHINKGTKIAITGHIQTGSYEKDGQKVYTTDVVVDQVAFVESRKENNSSSAPDDAADFVPEIDEEELPFH